MSACFVIAQKGRSPGGAKYADGRLGPQPGPHRVRISVAREALGVDEVEGIHGDPRVRLGLRSTPRPLETQRASSKPYSRAQLVAVTLRRSSAESAPSAFSIALCELGKVLSVCG